MLAPPEGREHRIALGGTRDDELWAFDLPGPSDDAPALLLIHGLGVTSHLTWGPSYSELARHFRVVAYDQRGHGRGPRTGHFELEASAADGARILDALGIERAVVVGYSLGGTVASLLWRAHRERVAGLVLAATAPEFGRARRARILRRLWPIAAALIAARPETVRERLRDRAMERLAGLVAEHEVERELAGHQLPTVLRAALAAADVSSRGWLDEIDVPVSVLVTSDDDRIAAERQRALAGAIPHAVRFETPGPHTACVTRRETFVPDLVAACTSAARRAAAATTERIDALG